MGAHRLPDPVSVYGYVYELHTSDPGRDSEHPYVGKAVNVDARVYTGRNPHTGDESVAKDPWKARILPAPHGYTILSAVPRTDDPRADEVRLRKAEAFWIAELDTKYNRQRPVYAPGSDRAQPRRPAPAARGPVLNGRAAATRRVRRMRGWAFVALWTLATVLVGRILLAGDVAGAWFWVGAPAFGLPLGGLAFSWLDRMVRAVVQPVRPRARSRRRR